jgi:AcrR family transcriptional regulator
MSKADVAAERKEQIVRATAYDCISKFGYHNFSMQDVARTAGVQQRHHPLLFSWTRMSW